MYKVITNKAEFIENPILEMNEEQLNNAKTNTITLYGKEYKMYDDEWKHHVHIKCTDHCDSNCEFCIEMKERNNPQNKEEVMNSTVQVLSQMAMQGQLRTVSITGGEPTIFPLLKELVTYINSYKLTLFSINTNGRFLDNIPTDFEGWVNISKHAVDDKDVFKRDFVVTPSDIVNFKRTHQKAKVRLQCVLGVTSKMKTISDIVDFIFHYGKYVDDFSFRNLIIDGDEEKVDGLLFELRDTLFKGGEFIEQVIQDYYVYETYKMFGTSITISWSNMKKLRDYNESHDNNFLEEIIVHPDGTVSGSWNKKSLIIHENKNKKGNTFIPCEGVGCKTPCKRHVTVTQEYPIDTCSKNSYKVSSCSKTVSSC